MRGLHDFFADAAKLGWDRRVAQRVGDLTTEQAQLRNDNAVLCIMANPKQDSAAPVHGKRIAL